MHCLDSLSEDSQQQPNASDSRKRKNRKRVRNDYAKQSTPLACIEDVYTSRYTESLCMGFIIKLCYGMGFLAPSCSGIIRIYIQVHTDVKSAAHVP